MATSGPVIGGVVSAVGPAGASAAAGASATGGGGTSGFPNEASNSWATVAGGAGNTASGSLATVSGGSNNTASFFAALKRREPRGELRLPTGAEWTYAAQAGEASPPQASAETANCANKEANDGYEGAAPVGSYTPTALGLYDMLGNASEWVSDDDGSGKRIRRGGSFKNPPQHCSPTFAGHSPPDARPEDAGFRIVRELKR